MTTAGEGGTPTALDLLFGPGADAAEILAGEILSPGGDQNLGRALAHLSETTRKAAVQQAASTMAALLKVDLIGALARGWREHRDIVSAARRTLAAPGSTELVSMTAHEVTVDQRPSVSVLVDGQPVATLNLGLSIVFDVNALLLGISGGPARRRPFRSLRNHRYPGRSGRRPARQACSPRTPRCHLDAAGNQALARQRIPTGEHPPGEDTGSEPQGSEYPAERDDASAPWWQSARSVPPPSHRT